MRHTFYYLTKEFSLNNIFFHKIRKYKYNIHKLKIQHRNTKSNFDTKHEFLKIIKDLNLQAPLPVSRLSFKVLMSEKHCFVLHVVKKTESNHYY